MQCETKLLPWYTFHPSCFTFVFRKNRDNIMPLDLHPLSLSGTFIKNYIYAASIKIGLFWVSFVLNCCVFLFVSFSFGEASSFDWNLFRKIREVKERKKIHFSRENSGFFWVKIEKESNTEINKQDTLRRAWNWSANLQG